MAPPGLHSILQFNAVEADIIGLSPRRRMSARRTRTAPEAAAFGSWLRIQHRKLSTDSWHTEIITDIHNQSDRLKNFQFANYD